MIARTAKADEHTRSVQGGSATCGNADAGQQRRGLQNPKQPGDSGMKPGPGGQKTHTSVSGEPRPFQAAKKRDSHPVTVAAPVENSENLLNRCPTGP
jgi:hypothetical protein